MAGLVFAVWELSLIGAALWKVSRRHQFRRHYRVPVEIAGVVDRSLVRVVDLTPGGAGIIAPYPMEVGSEVRLHLDVTDVSGNDRGVDVRLTICSCRPAAEVGWRMGGTLTPVTDDDGEALIEHCHVVSTRARLLRSGRLLADDERPTLSVVPDEARLPLSAHG